GGGGVCREARGRQGRGLGKGVFDDRRFDRRIRRGAGRGAEPGNRRDVKDGARTGFFEEGKRRPARPDRRQQIHRNADGPASLVITGPEPRGVVDKYVTATVLSGSLLT